MPSYSHLNLATDQLVRLLPHAHRGVCFGAREQLLLPGSLSQSTVQKVDEPEAIHLGVRAANRRPQATSRRPQARPQATGRKPQAASHKPQTANRTPPTANLMSRDPSFQKTPETQAKGKFLKRTMVEKNGELTPRIQRAR